MKTRPDGLLLTIGMIETALYAEAERPELLAAVFGDLVGAPRRHPDPVDLDVVDELAHERGAGLVLDHVGERAGRAGERHVDHGDALGLLYAVHQAEVDDVDAQLGVDHVAHGLFEVLDRRLAALRGRLRHACRTPNHGLLGFTHDFSSDRTSASLNAIQPSKAHFTRAGYRATPANATPSPSTSSSG